MKEENGKVRVNIRIPVSVNEKIEAEMLETGETKSTIIRKAISDYYHKRESLV